MNRMMAIAVLTGSLCAGCASPPPVHEGVPAVAKFERIAGPTVYAKLAQTPAGYRFQALSAYQPSNHEPWVRLNSLTPAFATAPERECELGATIVGELHVKPTCISLDPALFRVDRMTGGQKVEKAITTVWTVGTIGTSRITTIEFDVQAYSHAVDEAISALGMDRAEVVKTYASLATEHAELEKSNAALRQRAQPRVNVIDDSGFYTAGTIDFAANVAVDAPDLARVPDVPLTGPISPSQLQATFDAGFRHSWMTDNLLFTVRCSGDHQRDFNFTMDCPSTASGDELAKGLPVTVHVTSKSLRHLLPKTFLARDKVLTVSLEGNAIQLSNDSHDFVNVTNVTVYYAGKAITIKTAQPIPPQTKLARPLDLNEFTRDLPSSDRPTLTAARAAQSTVSFGLAAHYTNSSGSATVYREEQFSELALANQ